MLETIFNTFYRFLETGGGVTLLASFFWGIFSVLLSPCHLASIPLIVGYMSGSGVKKRSRAFIISFVFSLGILINIGVVGLITGLAGRMLGDIGPYANYFVAGVMFLTGLYLLNIIKIPFLDNYPGPEAGKKGVLGAFLLGLIFGLALGPCTFAFMVPVLTIAFSKAASNFGYSILLVALYGLGHCLVIVIAGVFGVTVGNILAGEKNIKRLNIFRKACGLILILAGVYIGVKGM